ncbi:hypothetical protein [Candidatus Binatus sp.]|jgi:hypothetical protein
MNWDRGPRRTSTDEGGRTAFISGLRELEASKVIGELADPAFSFMGGIY